MAAPDLSIVRQPRWLLAIVVAAVLALAFVRLGIWQLDRLEERKSMNEQTELRRVEPVRPVEGLVGQYGADPEQLHNRPATATGVYDVGAEFVSIGRTYGDLTGSLVATPLHLDDGSILIIIRGLVPPDTPAPPASGFEPPPGQVTVFGVLSRGEAPLRLGEPDPEGGTLSSLSRIDLAYVDRWLDGPVLPFMMVLEAQQPTNADKTPVPVPQEELTEGSHLGYAVQWFAFAIIVIVGVGVLIWRAARPATPDERDRTDQETESRA